MSLGDLETQEDANELLGTCCPCKMSLCPVIVKVCRSRAAHFSSVGFTNEEDETFALYRRSGFTGTHVQSVTIPFEGGPEDGLTSLIIDADYEIFSGREYDILYEGNVGLGSGCPTYTPVYSESKCSGSGTSRQRQYFYYGFDDSHGIAFELSRVLAMVGGAETEEHVAWSAAFGAAIAAWDVAHPTGPTWQEASATHAAWEAVRDEHDAWAACEIDTPGECGDEPPEEGAEPENPGIDDEPTEFYAACTFRITTTYQHYPRWWGPSPGDAPDEDDDLYQDWLDGLVGGADPPCPGTGELRVYEGFIGVSGSMNPGFTGGMPGTPYTETEGFTEPATYAEWIAEVQAIIDAEMTLPSETCEGEECTSRYEVTAEPEGGLLSGTGAIILDARRAEVRFQIPATWPDQFSGVTVPFTGDYYGITYDVVDTPDGWDDLVPTVFRSFHLEDQPLEWEGPGSGDQSDPSWLTDAIALDPPGPEVTRSVENIRFVCQPDSPWGTLPQVIGTAVTLPDS